MRFYKIAVLLLLLAACTQGASAQKGGAGDANIDSVKKIMQQLYHSYDSLSYITFDVRYTLYSDTLYSDFSYETIKGVYTMNGKKGRYTLGDAEYLQNDSFLLAVFHNDQQIIVSRPQAVNTGDNMPMRAVIDSLLQVHAANYNITCKNTPSGEAAESTTGPIGYIRLLRKAGNTIAAYNSYSIEFNITSNMITKIEFSYTEPGQELTVEDEPDEGQRLLKNADRKKTLQIEFLNYRFDHFNDDWYSENQFVWWDNDQYKPVAKFQNYQVLNARN